MKDPLGTKGARLSTQVSIAGRFLVSLPTDKHIGVSQKIELEETRETLKDRIAQLAGENCHDGFIIRTLAESANDEEFRADIDYLRRVWKDIEARSSENKAPNLIYEDLDLSVRILRDYLAEDSERILVDSRETFQKMTSFAQSFIPQLSSKVQLYTSERPIFERYGVEDEIERALGRRVNLQSGGYLVIDQTEALITVDVNTGGFVGDRNFEETVYKNNLEAAQAIARQIRLRNLGGIILIDFIDMDNESHKISILEELEKAVSFDRTRVNINGFTQLGLVEMTRKERVNRWHIFCASRVIDAAVEERSKQSRQLATKYSEKSFAKQGNMTLKTYGSSHRSRSSIFSRRRVSEHRDGRRIHWKNDTSSIRPAVRSGAVRHRANLNYKPVTSEIG